VKASSGRFDGARRATRWTGRAATVALTVHGAVNGTLLRVPPAAAPVPGRVTVLVPARNEAERIGPTLAAALASSHVPSLEILVLDDGSTDGTADVVAALASSDPRLRLIRAVEEPPPGWLGKPWACARLAGAADPLSTVLVFLDADVVLAPDGLARTVRLLREAELGFVSPYPRQVAEGAAERLIQPLLQWSWLTFLPLRLAEHATHPSLAVANGQLLAVDAGLYRRSGGHRAVAGAVLDDIALARVLRATGGHGGMADGTTVATCRMYRGWPEIRDGYAKSLWAAAGGRPVRTAGQVALLTALYCRPDPVSYAAAVLGRVLTGRRTGARTWPDALAHPLSIAAFAWLSCLSWWRHRGGTLTWKGRTLPRQSVPAL
jgi:glycosyltransferase involved in cell wall biosynthesis